MATPRAQKNASNPAETVTLPSGSIATKLPFKGKHVKQARRLSDDNDPESGIYALISLTVLIDGKSIVVEDLDEIDGRDLLALMAEFNGLF